MPRRPVAVPLPTPRLAALVAVVGVALFAWPGRSVLVLLEDAQRTVHRLRVRADGARWCIESSEGPLVAALSVAAQLDGQRLEIESGGVSEAFTFVAARDAGSDRVWLHGAHGIHVFTRVDRTAHALAGTAAAKAAAGNTLRAPMPGLVSAVPTTVGALVRAGEANGRMRVPADEPPPIEGVVGPRPLGRGGAYSSSLPDGSMR
mgnify:CR=1 FL=1